MALRPPLRTPRRAIMLLAALVAVASAGAQGRGGPGGGGPGGMSHNPFGNNLGIHTYPPGGSQPNGPGEGTLRGGLQLGPPGRWWDDRRFATSIGLDPGQQHRMDDAFAASKGTLVKLYRNLQHEESQLEKVTRARELNEAQIFDQIDRLVQARGELEKASAHMLLQIRKEMTPEQAARLDDHRPQSQ